MPSQFRSKFMLRLCLIATAVLWSNLAMSADKPLDVPARLLPVPTTVSEQLAKFIAAPLNPTAHDDPKTVEDWQALIDAYNSEGDKGARALWSCAQAHGDAHHHCRRQMLSTHSCGRAA